jgi:hypothetical protein
MIAVYKYPVDIEDVFTVLMPVRAEVLTVQMQHGLPCIWARVNTAPSPVEVRRFRWAGTGHPLGEQADWHYVGTVQMQHGDLVFHLFAEYQP